MEFRPDPGRTRGAMAGADPDHHGRDPIRLAVSGQNDAGTGTVPGTTYAANFIPPWLRVVRMSESSHPAGPCSITSLESATSWKPVRAAIVCMAVPCAKRATNSERQFKCPSQHHRDCRHRQQRQRRLPIFRSTRLKSPRLMKLISRLNYNSHPTRFSDDRCYQRQRFFTHAYR